VCIENVYCLVCIENVYCIVRIENVYCIVCIEKTQLCHSDRNFKQKDVS